MVARKKTENCHKILITKLSGRIHSTIPYKVIVLNTSNLIHHNITHTLVWLFLSYNNGYGDSHAEVRQINSGYIYTITRTLREVHQV